MEAAKILQANALDILFENRNKAYGAYSLRKNYQKQLSLALLITFIIAAGFSVYSLFHKKNSLSKFVPPTVISVNTVAPPKHIEKPKMKIIKQKAAEPLKIKSQKFTVPAPTADKNVTEIPPKQDSKLTIGPVTQNGKEMKGLLGAPPEVKGLGGKHLKLDGSKEHADGDGKFVNIQVEAKFPGGDEAWRKYLTANLRQNIPLDNGAQQGRYIVTVSFLVSVDGSISDVKAIDAPNPDFGTAAEAVRVIMRGPKWSPAIQNGKPVPYHQKQKIIFEVQEQ